MQETIFYVAAGETLGAVRDFANAKSAAPPTLVKRPFAVPKEKGCGGLMLRL